MSLPNKCPACVRGKHKCIYCLKDWPHDEFHYKKTYSKMCLGCQCRTEKPRDFVARLLKVPTVRAKPPYKPLPQDEGLPCIYE